MPAKVLIYSILIYSTLTDILTYWGNKALIALLSSFADILGILTDDEGAGVTNHRRPLISNMVLVFAYSSYLSPKINRH